MSLKHGLLEAPFGNKLGAWRRWTGHEIVWLLATWPDVVKTVSRDHQASTIVTFCFKLTHAISSAWEKLIVKGQDRDDALVRLWLYRCAKDVLGSALRLLTITPLERM